MVSACKAVRSHKYNNPFAVFSSLSGKLSCRHYAKTAMTSVTQGEGMHTIEQELEQMDPSEHRVPKPMSNSEPETADPNFPLHPWLSLQSSKSQRTVSHTPKSTSWINNDSQRRPAVGEAFHRGVSVCHILQGIHCSSLYGKATKKSTACLRACAGLPITQPADTYKSGISRCPAESALHCHRACICGVEGKEGSPWPASLVHLQHDSFLG